MKLLITSVDAIIDFRTNAPFAGIIEVLDFFKSLEQGNEVVVISSHEDKLTLLPKEISAVQFAARHRGSNSPIESFLATQSDYNDRSKIIVLAANDADFLTAVNTKLLMLGAGYAKENEPYSKAYKYGLQIASVQGLRLFFERFFTIKNPWYYRLDLGNAYRVYSLTNANTKGYRSQNTIQLNLKFKQCLKEGNEDTRNSFVAYFMMGIYDIVNEVENIDFWATYPSSSVEQESDLDYFKELARTTFKIRAKDPLFIRYKKAEKRSTIYNASQRISDGCENQFDTMHLNPKYRNKLKGKTVGVIDDFTSYGTSGETIRMLLSEAGVDKIIFLTLGKFGKLYYKYNYVISGDVFAHNYSAKRIGQPELLTGRFNDASDEAFVNSLKGIV